MNAIVYNKYGPPEVLYLQEIERPLPGNDEVLIKVKASTVTPMDWRFRNGKTFIARMMTGVIKPKIKILGIEFSGDVVMVGSKVKKFKETDEVFGRAKKGGAHAEYISVSEDEIELKPSESTFQEAAGITFCGTTALFGLRNTEKVQRGQKVLVDGASGGVGTFGVQLAKFHKTEVSAVCRGSNHDLVKKLGADKVIDYWKEDFTLNRVQYDIISTVLTFPLVVQMILTSMFGGKKAKYFFTDFKSDDLRFLKEMIDDGKLRTVIDKSFPLNDIVEAHRYAELGHAKGKVIVTIP